MEKKPTETEQKSSKGYELQELPSQPIINPAKKKQRKSSESIFTEEEQTLPRILLNSFSQGIPTSFTYGDFYYCMITVRVILSSTGQLSLLAASAYSTSYFAICMHCLISATVDTQSTLGSQAFGKRDYQKLNLYLKQSLFVCFSLVFIFVVLPCCFLDTILEFFGAQEDLVGDTKSIILWSMPGYLVRIFGDNLKVYIQNQGKMQEIGKKSFLIFCLFVPLSCVLVGVYNMGAAGIGISLIVYELSCCQLCFWIINKRCPVNPFREGRNQAQRDNQDPLVETTNIRDTDGNGSPSQNVSLFETIADYYKYTSKVFVARIGTYLCWDSVAVIVGLLNSKEQLAAFGIAFLLGSTNYGTSRGVIVYNAIIINEKLGKGDKQAAYNLYLKCFKSAIITGIAFASSFLVICLCMIFLGGFENEEVRDIFIWIVPSICLHCFQVCLYNLSLKMWYSLGYFNLAIYCQSFDFICVIFNYYFTYLKGYGGPCGYLMPNIGLIFKNAVGILSLQWRIDWHNFKGL